MSDVAERMVRCQARQHRSHPRRANGSTAPSLQPTPAQVGAWDGIAGDDHVLVVAPTGSGKTLAAFLTAIDELMRPGDSTGTRVLYISPLKALAVDVERNLRSPLVGITHAAARRGDEFREVTVGLRSGDTSAKDRRALVTRPPDILITTPESLFLMLTSAARETLRGRRHGHRRRDPRRRRHQARRPPGGVARATRRPARTSRLSASA